MKQTFFMLSMLIASIIGLIITIWYIDAHLRESSEISSCETVKDSIKITTNK